MLSVLTLRQSWIRLTRDKTRSALIVAAVGTTLGAAVCASSFTYLVHVQALPYPESERLVVAEQIILDHDANSDSRHWSYPAIASLHRASQGIFSASVMMDHARDIVMSHPAQPLVAVTYTTPDYAALFAPPMIKGRFPDAGRNADAARPQAVISHAAWQTLFDRREDVLGMSVRTASGADFEVVGVTARDFVEPEFHGPGYGTALWLPWDFNPSPKHWGWSATTDSLTFAGRLAPEVSVQRAAERLSVLLNAPWHEELGTSSGARSGWSTRVDLTRAQQALGGDGLQVGPLLLAGTIGLILVTLANVIHLLVARVAERSGEFSIQLALGASNRHLRGMVLADMLLLMLPASMVAVGVALSGFRLMQHYLGTMLPRLAELSLGWPTAALTITMAVVLAVMLAGMALVSTPNPAAGGALNAGRATTAIKVSRRFRALLMASQVGVASLLIAISVGLLRDATLVLNERGIDLERSASTFLFPRASTDQASTDQGGASIEQQLGKIRRQLEALPGVESVSQSHSPLQDFIKTAVVSGRSGAPYPVELKRIDHAFFDITAQRLAQGRNFGPDRNPDVAIVNAAFARLLEREGGALGTPLSRQGETPHLVIGVVEDLTYPGSSAGTPRLYLPSATAGSNFVIKFRPGERMGREQWVAFVTKVSPGLGVFLYDNLSQQRSDILLPRRITALTTALVALLVMLVSGMGLYGMVSYTTRLRRTEIGARLAFGAGAHHILLMLIRNNLAAVLCGCAGSAAVAALLLPGIQLGFGIRPFDVRWMDVAAAIGSLGLLATLACYLSARPLLAQSPALTLRESG